MGRRPRAGRRARHGFGIYNAALGIGGLVSSLMFGVIWTRVSPSAAFFTGAARGCRRDRAAILVVFT